MKKALFLLSVAVLCSTQVFGWGQKGHDIAAYVAEQHLSKKVAQKVTSVLEGHSLVYYANWMDNASHTKEYAYTSTWHYANVDEGYTYETMPRNEKGDVVGAVKSIVTQLCSGELTAQQENEAVRMLIHLVGDMHCPMHAGRKSDVGGNRTKIKFFNRETSLHKVWDSQILETWNRPTAQQLADFASKYMEGETPKITWKIDQSIEIPANILVDNQSKPTAMQPAESDANTVAKPSTAELKSTMAHAAEFMMDNNKTVAFTPSVSEPVAKMQPAPEAKFAIKSDKREQSIAAWVWIVVALAGLISGFVLNLVM